MFKGGNGDVEKDKFFRASLVGCFAIILFTSRVVDCKDLVKDPSEVALNKIDAVHFDERSRIRGDFNLDGLVDMALSEPLNTIGQGGNLGYSIFLQDSSGLFEEYAKIETIWGRLAVEKVGKKVHLWVSGHMGGGETALGYYVLTDSGLGKGDGMVIWCGPVPNISCAIYEAVFENSEAEITVEHSQTTNGKVEWLPGRD